MAHQVGEGVKSYFETQDSSTPCWVLPAEQLDDWLKALTQKAEALTTHSDDVPSAASKRDKLPAFLKDIKSKSSKSTGAWAVKLHADTGQV